MSRKILIFSYWFPPNNAIGASRGAAMARFFHQHGWGVTVIAANSAAVPTDFDVDLAGIEVHRVEDTTATQLRNIKLDRALPMRVFSALLRFFAFPDVFASTTVRMGKLALQLVNEQGRDFDVVLSSALPFSQHSQAVRVARNVDACLVLDNRDMWACNAYRRRLPFTDARERELEKKIFSSADIVSSISESMSRHYKDSYPELGDKFFAIRNGTDVTKAQAPREAEQAERQLKIVYTGILYGGKRDVRPILRAARKASSQIVFEFYGSETAIVSRLQEEFPELTIVDRGRVERKVSMEAQLRADILLVALGHDAAEKTFLPGKFFEYVGTGRPIVVLADQDFEISQLVDEFELGVATRDEDRLSRFLQAVSAGDCRHRPMVPEPLTREYQLRKLESLIESRMKSADSNEAGDAR